MSWWKDNWGKIFGIAGSVAGMTNPVAGAALGGLYDMFTNERNRGDYLQQQQHTNDFADRQQNFAEETTLNAAQIRRQDLEAAGLHPTLAAGGAASTSQAHMPSTGSARNNQSGLQTATAIAQVRQLQAQADMTSAEAERLRAEKRRIEEETDYIGRRWNLDYQRVHGDLTVRQIQNQIQQFTAEIRQQSENRLLSLRDLEQELLSAKVSETTHKNVMQILQNRYTEEHKSLMPVRDIMNHEFEKALLHLGIDDSDAVLTVFRVLKFLLNR